MCQKVRRIVLARYPANLQLLVLHFLLDPQQLNFSMFKLSNSNSLCRTSRGGRVALASADDVGARQLVDHIRDAHELGRALRQTGQLGLARAESDASLQLAPEAQDMAAAQSNASRSAPSGP